MGTAIAQPTRVLDDMRGDAGARRTDTGADGELHPDGNLPDILRVELAGWVPEGGDRFVGRIVDPSEAHLFRITLIFDGLLNPPGTLGLRGQPYDPFAFGPSPLLGYLDLDIDDDIDTGGELGAGARQRFLANIGRFGARAPGPLAGRTARRAGDYDADFFSVPQYERTGADFAMALCGCWRVDLVRERGNGDGIMQADEAMVVAGRFFERAGGYAEASRATGGSGFGLYDPVSHVLFAHDAALDRTAVVFVGPLDMRGAAIMLGGEVEAPDRDVRNHWSVLEALEDIIAGAGSTTGPARVLTGAWAGRRAEAYLDPTMWTASAMFAAPYLRREDALFAWTDEGFEAVRADVTGDGALDGRDRLAVQRAVYDGDGTAADPDGSRDGRLPLRGFGPNFALWDLDYSGVIEGEDLWAYGHRADVDGDGALTFFDFLAFQNAFAAGAAEADFDLDQEWTFFDFLAFQNAFSR